MKKEKFRAHSFLTLFNFPFERTDLKQVKEFSCTRFLLLVVCRVVVRTMQKKMWGRHHRFFPQRISRIAETRALSKYYFFFIEILFVCVMYMQMRMETRDLHDARAT